jgi:3-methyl-2-oxobutanoate hydroxymethyltransferase
MLGMDQSFTPKFLRRYADLSSIISDAVGQYVKDVKDVSFPNEQEQY